MSVTINAKGTSVPYFKLGKSGSTLYQGTSDPSGSYTILNGDIWFDTSANQVKFRSSGSWASPPGSGTVTSVSVVTANGVSGSVANSTTTPAITLTLGAITPSSVAATGTVTGSNLSGTNTGDQTITLTGDVTGSGTGSFATTLATVNSSPQTDQFRKITVNGKGLVTASTAVGSSDIITALGYTPYNSTNPDGYTTNTGTVTTVSVTTANGVSGSVSNASTTPAISLTLGAITPSSVAATGNVTGANLSGTNTGDQTITLTGDVTGSGTGSFAATLATVNSSPQTDQLRKITVNGKGLVTATSAVTTSDLTPLLDSTYVNVTGDTMTGNLDMGGNTLTGLAAPSAGTDATNKNYVDAAIAGLTWKTSVRAATTTNGTLASSFANGQVIDGVTLATGDRILIKNQTTQTQNGIYIVAASGAPTRSTDADTGTELVGASVYVDQGTVNADTGWTQTANAPITIGSTNITWVQFAGSGTYTAGTGLSLTGNTFANTGVLSLTGGTNINVSGSTGNITVSVTGSVASASTLATPRSITATGDASWTVNFDGSANVTAGLTLATVNSSPQTDTFRKVTVNGKGLVTATSAVTTSDITALVDSTYVNVTGDTMTGTLNLPSNGLVAGTNQLVVSGGFVGVGTASPLTQLHVNANSTPANVTSTTALVHLSGADNGTSLINIDGYGSIPSIVGRRANGTAASKSALTANQNLLILDAGGYGATGYSSSTRAGYRLLASENWTDSAQGTYATINLTPNGSTTIAEVLRVDNAGNVGIGATPSAWSSTYKAIELGSAGGGAVWGNSSNIVISENTYYTGSWVRTAAAATAAYQLSTGTHLWYTDASGTAGVTYVPTERMRLDTSGNVGIGLTPVASNGILQLNSYASIKALLETATVTASAPASTTNFDLITQAVQYYTSNASANFTLNIRGNSGTSLNTIMQTGQSATLSLLVTNGGTAFRPTAFQIDGNAVTPKWQGGVTPSAGNINSIDIYTLTIIKTASATFTVLATQTQFA